MNEEQKTGMSEEQIAFIKQAAQNKLINFCEVINPKWETVWFHEMIADILQKTVDKVRNKQKVRIILSIPPRMGKSQTSSIYFPAWALGKYPDLKIILSTYGAELSEKMGLQTRDTISSDAYKMIFPGVELRSDQRAKAKWMTNKGGSYTAVGVGGAVTGVGADIIIVDDILKSREEAESETIRETAWEYYRSTLYSRLEGHGAVIVVMQRWHDDDLVGRLMAEEKEKREAGEKDYDEWEVINFPAIAEADEYYEGKLVRKEGEPLWPSKFPISVLNTIKQTAGIYNWSSQYMQSPISRETQEFKEHMFRYFDEGDLNGKYLRYYTLVDPAISQDKKADNSVVLTIAKEVNGPNIYRVREDAGHYTPQELIDLIFVHQNEYSSRVFVEAVQYQQAIKYAILEQQRKLQKYFLINEIKSKTKMSKESRIRGILPLYATGVIFHRRTDTEYEKELLTFPSGKRDDRCLIAGTKVSTIFGDKNIEDIKIGDYVVSPFGVSRVINSKCTGKKEVISNIGLTGTFDHKIFDKETGSFALLSKMTYNQCISIRDIIKWKLKTVSYLMEKNTNSWGREDIILANQKLIKEKLGPKAFMSLFGKKLITQLSLKGLLSITKTATHLTMMLLILNVYHASNMLKSTKENILKKTSNTLTQLDLWLQNGTNQKKEDCGTKNMQEILSQKQKRNLLLRVCFVTKKKSTQLYMHLLNFVRQNVHNLSIGLMERIKKQGHVSSVQKNLNQVSTQTKTSVIDTVYNITTDHGVYFANGVLVSNCDTMSFLQDALDPTYDSQYAKQTRTKFKSYFARRE